MSKLQEIETALPDLSPSERADLERGLREAFPANEAPSPLPDYAARRRAIYGERVLPNMVLDERDSIAA